MWKAHREYLLSGLDKNTRERHYRVLFPAFRHSLNLLKIRVVYHIIFILYMKNPKKHKTYKKPATCKIFHFIMGLQHIGCLWTKAHLQGVNHHSCQYSSFFCFDPKVFLLSILEKFVITPKSSLFCKLCCPYHFWCRAFVQRMFIPVSVTLFPLSMSPAYPKKQKCQSVLYPMSHRLVLVRCLCWMMWDVSMPSFQQSRPIDFSSLSRTETRDLYSTFGACSP